MVIILRGGSGCGKTTWARNMHPDGLIFSADRFFEIDGNYVFDVNRIGEAHAWCLRQFTDECIDRRFKKLIVDNTNTRISEFAPYVAMAMAYGWDVSILTFWYNPAKAFERNVHGVPLNECINQHQRLMEQSKFIPPWWKHEYILSDIP